MTKAKSYLCKLNYGYVNECNFRYVYCRLRRNNNIFIRALPKKKIDICTGNKAMRKRKWRKKPRGAGWVYLLPAKWGGKKCALNATVIYACAYLLLSAPVFLL